MNEISVDYLNSLLEYKLVAQFGPIHELVFVMAVRINGEMYYGLGSSKKKAKNNAAENVFQSLKNQLKNGRFKKRMIENCTAHVQQRFNGLEI